MSGNPESPRLPPGQQLVAADKWPLVGERTPADTGEPWTLTVAGRVRQSVVWDLSQLAELPATKVATDIHCVTRWSKLDVAFQGVLLAELLQRCEVLEGARYVSFVARSARQHSSSLPLAEALSLGTLIATSADDRPLSREHGGPVRVVVPGKYFYKSVKWLQRIELLEADRLGYWESAAGYHNQADPWLEQRFVAASISKREAARLIERRDISHMDLLSFDASGHELPHLRARGAVLRNADFSNCNLNSADFRGANLSNARFRAAQLANANFNGADLEGVDFSQADLRGADLTDCSLFGTSFGQFDPQQDALVLVAKIDTSTKLEPQQLESLTIPQRDFVVRALRR